MNITISFKVNKIKKKIKKKLCILTNMHSGAIIRYREITYGESLCKNLVKLL